MKPYLLILLVAGVIILGVSLGWRQMKLQAKKANDQFSPQFIQALSIEAVLAPTGELTVSQQIEHLTAEELSWPIFTNARRLKVLADGVPVEKKLVNVSRMNDRQIVSVAKTRSRNWRLEYLTTTTLIRTEQQDRIFLKLLNGPGQSIEKIKINLFLPGQVKKGLSGNLYAIGGARNSQTQLIAGNQISYSLDSGSPEVVVTINANWPKELLSLSAPEEFRLTLFNLSVLPWLVLGFVLPLGALAILGQLRWRRRRNEQPVDSVLSQPPSNLPAILVGVLVNKKIYPQEVAALLIDLCQRGYLVIVNKHNRFHLGQRQEFGSGLRPWEHQVLQAIFTEQARKIGSSDLKSLTRRLLFSPNIKVAFCSIYQEVTELGYFRENPHLTRVKYKLVGLGFYFASAFGLVWTAVTGASPYLLIPITGSLLISFLIIKLTPQLSNYSSLGLTERAKWLSFANWLALNQSLPLEDSLNQTFDRYLPYAIALGRTHSWAHRFDVGKTVLVRPDWLVSFNSNDDTASEYVQQMADFVRELSAVIIDLRGPLVA